MKRILLFITATLLLASGTSCSDDNTNFDPIGDELGIPYKDGHDVYGVEVWEETSVILTNYSLVSGEKFSDNVLIIKH
ncbi:hypothetical protein, partial [Alistipes putredinis]|uniref:hypothetical protein n=1 Tax=Alistipes putredinis TaxID=28117 RepID=UPI00307769A4